MPRLAGAAAAAPTPAVDYRIEARLDADARTVTGRVHARWRNPSRAPVDALYLHLYLNAFESNRTTLMLGVRDEAERWFARYPSGWGRIDLAALRIDGRDVLGTLEFVRPDDGNADDRTLARLPLAHAVPPHGEVELEADFIATLPRIFMRTGHAAPFFCVAQWFPKLAAFRDGAWRAHQFHATSEFSADFGTYDVAITVPDDYVVGYTGVAREQRDNGDGTQTIEVHAEAVHDFAWVADPRFVVVEDRIGETPVRLLLQPQHRAQATRYLTALRAAMTRYADWIEPYPYPSLTVVDPGPGGFGAAGMEYPMLITVGTSRWLPAGVRLPELLTVHEFGHQYWYGVVATDEVEEPWLDEGVNSYVEGLIMDAAYGPGSYLDWLGLQVDAVASQRWSYLDNGQWDPVAMPSFRMLDRASYHATAYAKTALVLATVAGEIGADRLLQGLGDYARSWRFRHPSERDFRASLSASSGRDLQPLLETLLHGTGTLDYAVERLEVRRVPPRAPSGGAAAMPSAETPRYRSEVIIARRGELRLPVDILVSYEDGSQTRETWDGEGRWRRIDATSTRQADFAIV
ncbi:MAG: M1 family metallopeptidase, partial [bacterium]